MNRLLSRLGAPACDALRPHLRPVVLQHDQVLSYEGDEVSEVCFPETAVLSCVRTMVDGRAVEVGSIGSEGMAGLLPCLSGAVGTSRIVACHAGEATMIRSTALRAEVLRDVGLLRVLLGAAADQLQEVERESACLALHDTTSRLAKSLLRTQDRVRADTFTLTQHRMAGMIGVQRTTVNQSAGHLRRLGAIHYRRGRIHIRDRAVLEAQACECRRPEE